VTQSCAARQKFRWIKYSCYRLKSRRSIEIILFLIATILYSWGEGYATPELGLDPSWAEGLVNATDNGRIFGKDVVFTFGPYHQLYTYQISSNLVPFLIGRWMLGLSAGAAAVTLGRITSLSWGFALTISLWLLPSRNSDGLFGVLATLFVLGCLYLRRTRSASLLLYLIYLGIILGTYTKLSFLGSALPAVAAGAVLRWRSNEGWPSWPKIALCAASLIAPWPLLWILSGQPASSLISYFSNGNLDMVTGFSSSMQTIDAAQNWQPPAYCLAVIVVLYFLKDNITKHLSNRTKIWVTISSLSVIAGVALKAGMVRHDGHVVTSAFYLFSFSVIVFALHQTSSLSPSEKNRSALLLIPMLVGLNLRSKHSFQSPLSKPERLVVNFKLLVGSSVRQHSRDYLATLRKLKLLELNRKSEKLPIPLGSSTDILPWDISDLTSQGINYKPRPIFQSYSAYTPTLQSLNATHFESINKPDFIVLRTGSIDERTPLEMDAPALLTISENYTLNSRGSAGSLILKIKEPKTTLSTSLLWKKALKGSDLSPDPKAEGFSTSWLMVKDLSRGSYLTISVKPTLTRKIQSAIFRSPPLMLEIKYSDRQDNIKIRILDKPLNIISLNPYIRSNDDLASFIQALSKSRQEDYSDQLTSLKLRILAPRNFAGVDEILLLVHAPGGVSDP
jgi:hypothetical protein